ncbi:MAG: thiol:disulfide interchange protein DsbA/DsbL [Alistipes senegalensis]|nr:thiol:disulfide interchange protein DsbA/DsbL [Oxalobacter formigenes]MCM1280394.1 thiol:disulfide interchange protein DsbA/DsbL [Alistipes senegalensis]
MKTLSSFFLAIGLVLAAAAASASPDHPVEGTDYLALENPLPAKAGNKVEVLEFFGYFCSHCRSFDAELVPWIKKQRGQVAFKRIHINYNDNMALQQRLFYTLSAMGKMTHELHHDIFDAVQIKRTRLRNESQLADFAQKNGIDRQAFLDMLRSFTVRSLCDGAIQLQTAYNIEGVPTIIIDGRYVTSLGIVSAGNHFDGTEKEAQAMTMKVMDNLVARILKERRESSKAQVKSAKK